VNWRSALASLALMWRQPGPAAPGPVAPPAQVAPAPPPPALHSIPDAEIASALRAAAPELAAGEAGAWAAAISRAWARLGIAGRVEVAHFLGQCAHESAGFRRMKEGFFYRDAAHLAATFPSRFPTADTARPFTRAPEKLAAFIYEGRTDLGNVHPGDGARFIGRGPIQLTGRDNYARFARAIGLASAEEAIPVLETIEGGALAAAWYWSVHGCGAAARAGGYLSDAAIDAVGRRINPKLAGRDDRRSRTRAAGRALGIA
jgi:putative chitinase